MQQACGICITQFVLSPCPVKLTLSVNMHSFIVLGLIGFYCFCVAAASYTYYTSLCQDETQKRKGIYAQRKTQRRRRERVVRVSVGREQ